MTLRTLRLRTAARHFWCSLTHGGGRIERDSLGRINWRCQKCRRWHDPVPLADEAAMTDAAIKRGPHPGGCTTEG